MPNCIFSTKFAIGLSTTTPVVSLELGKMTKIKVKMIRYCIVLGIIICAVFTESFATQSIVTQYSSLVNQTMPDSGTQCVSLTNPATGKHIVVYHQQAYISNTTNIPHFFPLPESEEYEEDDELEVSKTSLTRDNLSYITLVRQWFEGFNTVEQPLVAGSSAIAVSPTPLHIVLGVFRI